jgi:hypothetical protein
MIVFGGDLRFFSKDPAAPCSGQFLFEFLSDPSFGKKGVAEIHGGVPRLHP